MIIRYTYIILFILFLHFYTYSYNLLKTYHNNKFYYTQPTYVNQSIQKIILIENFINKLQKILIHNNFFKNNSKLKKNIIIKEIPPKYQNKYISYSSNKNTIYISLRNNNNSFSQDNNTLYFIIMHELSHILSTSYGHTTEFWTIYKNILQIAINNNLYIYKNYNKYPVYYSNFIINTTPI